MTVPNHLRQPATGRLGLRRLALRLSCASRPSSLPATRHGHSRSCCRGRFPHQNPAYCPRKCPFFALARRELGSMSLTTLLHISPRRAARPRHLLLIAISASCRQFRAVLVEPAAFTIAHLRLLPPHFLGLPREPASANPASRANTWRQPHPLLPAAQNSFVPRVQRPRHPVIHAAPTPTPPARNHPLYCHRPNTSRVPAPFPHPLPTLPLPPPT
jgi:hypothetical protein